MAGCECGHPRGFHVMNVGGCMGPCVCVKFNEKGGDDGQQRSEVPGREG